MVAVFPHATAWTADTARPVREKQKARSSGLFVQDLKKYGADEGSRTPDLLITNQLLYQLSYVGEEARSIKKRRG